MAMKRSHLGAVRIEPNYMAKGFKLKSDGINKILSSNGGFKHSDMFTTEFDINETPPSARTLLTKGYIQDEINTFSGATVSTRGRFMTEQEKSRFPNERPLYLYIQGHSQQNIDLAVQKIDEIIKTEHRSSMNRPSRFTNAPPPLMSLQPVGPSVEKIFIGIDNALPGFNLRERIIGEGGANLVYIRTETGANVTLRGRGSQFLDASVGAESPEPLHLYIEYTNTPVLQKAKELAINLIQTIQSELQTFMQQQPPPMQSQPVMQQPPMQQLPQAQFQTMNIGALGQPNVVTIQHQDIIQHSQSGVMTLPATILTATVAGTPAPTVPIPSSNVHGPGHAGPMNPNEQTQDLQTFVPPPSVSQMQLIGPPPTINQVQYQIHPGQHIQIQGMPPPCSQTSPQSMTQMYVMSQPPPAAPQTGPQPPMQRQNFMPGNSSAAPLPSGMSYVYTQPPVQNSLTQSQNIVETVNVNLQHPPPSANMNQQVPPPSLLQLHFPPPFPPNQPPPPISQYQIQYQQVPSQSAHNQTPFVLQHGEHLQQPPPQIQPNHESHQMHIPPFEGQQMAPMQMHGPPPPPLPPMPPPVSQAYVVSNSPQHVQQQAPMGGDNQQENLVEHVMSAPQPVPPPQMVPPPGVNHQMQQQPVNIITNVPPPTHMGVPGPAPQQAPWAFQGQESQNQGQLQMANMPVHNQSSPEIRHQMQVHYQNGQVPGQVHYQIQPPPTHLPYEVPDILEHQKSHGMKRRYSDVEGVQDPSQHPGGWPQLHRHGTGEGERGQPLHDSPGPGAGASPAERKLLMPPSYPGDKRPMDQGIPGLNEADLEHIGSDPSCNSGNVPAQLYVPVNSNVPPSWQGQHPRMPRSRPPLAPRDGELHPGCQMFPPRNMPPPHVRIMQDNFRPNRR